MVEYPIVIIRVNNSKMKSRYSSRSKDKIKEYSKGQLSSIDKGINIQIFNITSRMKNKSTARRDNSVNFDDFLHLTGEERIKRGNSVFQRRPKDNQINLSSYGPVVPNYDLVNKKMSKDSSKKLKASNMSMVLTSEGIPSLQKRELEEDMGGEDLHYEMVRFQQRCKNLIKK